MSDQKKSSNLPAVVLLILAYFGISSFPQGGLIRQPLLGPAAPQAPAAGSAAGADQPGQPPFPSTGQDDDDLGPLRPLFDHHGNALADLSESKDPDRRARLLARDHRLRLLIALVPDPLSTSMTHEFDPTLSAILRAAQSAGFVAERFAGMPGFGHLESLPDPRPVIAQPTATTAALPAPGADTSSRPRPDRPKRAWPASVLCKPTIAATSENEPKRLLVLLVPETPTQGVDKDRLVAAIDLVCQHRELHRACAKQNCDNNQDNEVRIIGPNFSGSVGSIARALGMHASDQTTSGDCQFVVYNGRALLVDGKRLSKEIKPRTVLFKSTVYDNTVLSNALGQFESRSSDSAQDLNTLAMLVESNTPFGLKNDDKPKAGKGQGKVDRSKIDSYTFPFGIARVREEYASKGYMQPNEPFRLSSPERLSPLDDAGKRRSLDTIPVVSRFDFTIDAELGLSQMLLELERQPYRRIEILSTNIYDRLFLATKVGQTCPDARLLFTMSAQIYAHHTVVPYLRGAIVASTYPLDLASQGWTASPGDSDTRRYKRVGFTSYFTQGIYNATVAHLHEMRFDDKPKLLDYSFPGDPLDRGVPPIWISVVGERGLYPLAVTRPTSDEIRELYQYHEAPETAAKGLTAKSADQLRTAPTSTQQKFGDNPPRIDSTWRSLFPPAMVAAIVCFGFYFFACLCPRRLSAELRQRVVHPTALLMARSRPRPRSARSSLSALPPG